MLGAILMTPPGDPIRSANLHGDGSYAISHRADPS
jgi:hypothetical protein